MEGAVLFYFINTASRFALAPYIGALRAPYRTPGILGRTDGHYMRSLEVPYLRCTAPNMRSLEVPYSACTVPNMGYNIVYGRLYGFPFFWLVNARQKSSKMGA